MFFPMIPDIGVDTDLVVLMERQAETPEQRMRKELNSFSEDLLKANEDWYVWGKTHPEDIVKYRYWFKSAHMMQTQVIPSMAWDFAATDPKHIDIRFRLIKQTVIRLLLAAPSEENGV